MMQRRAHQASGPAGSGSTPSAASRAATAGGRSLGSSLETAMIEIDSAKELAKARHWAAQTRDLHALSRLSSDEGAAAFLRLQRMRVYGRSQLRLNGVERSASGSSADQPQTEIATQTEPPTAEDSAGQLGSRKAQSPSDLLKRDEQ